MSPLLFIAFMDEIIKTTQVHTKPRFIGHRNLERVAVSECAFADDVAIVADTENALRNSVQVWNNALTLNGMKLNTKKSSSFKREQGYAYRNRWHHTETGGMRTIPGYSIPSRWQPGG